MKKTTALLLCLLILIPSALGLVSCDNSQSGNQETEPYETMIPGGDDENDPKIPAKDYQKYDFSFLTEDGDYFVDYIDSDGETNQLIPDAVYRRNTILEEKYNITISQIASASQQADIRSQVMAGATEFDAILARAVRLSTLARENLLYDLNTVEQFDMSKPYWDQNAKVELNIGSKLYYTNCDLNIRALPFMVFFNKQLVDDYQLTSPYEYMKNNEWTLDNFGKMIKSITEDMNNDGLMNENDRYGAQFEHNNVPVLMYGSGIRVTTLDATGYPELTLMGDKTVDVFEKIKDIYSDKNYSFCITCSSMGANGFAHKFDYARYLFTQDLALFHLAPSDIIPQFGDMEHEFGIVPIPKYDASQDRYYSLFSYHEVLFALPGIVPDIERTGNIIEDMNYYSRIVTVPVWFDTMLSRKYTRDDESEANLSIVKNTAVYDVGLYFDFGGVRSKILEVEPGNSNISTSFAKLKKAIQADIEANFK